MRVRIKSYVYAHPYPPCLVPGTAISRVICVCIAALLSALAVEQGTAVQVCVPAWLQSVFGRACRQDCISYSEGINAGMDIQEAGLLPYSNRLCKSPGFR